MRTAPGKLARRRYMTLVIPAFVTGIGVACSDHQPSFLADTAEANEVITVAPRPTLHLGVVDGEEAEQFDRIIGVTLIADTALAVVDAGFREIRFYDLEGRFLRAVGGHGEGPMELQSVSASWRRSDGRVEVVDQASGRVLVGQVNGETSSLRLPTESSGRFLSTRFVGRIGEAWLVQTDDPVEAPPAGEILRLTTSFHTWVGGAIGEASSIAVPSLWWYTTQQGRTVRLPLWVSPVPRASSSGNLGAVLDPASFRVHLYSAGISEWRTVVLPEACGEVPAGALDGDATESMELRAEIPLQEFRRLVPDCLPAYDRISTTSDGRVWVRRTRMSTGDESVDYWWVIGAGSEQLRMAELPRDFTPLDVSGDQVFGRFTDPLGVQFVRGYRIVE